MDVSFIIRMMSPEEAGYYEKNIAGCTFPACTMVLHCTYMELLVPRIETYGKKKIAKSIWDLRTEESGGPYWDEDSWERYTKSIGEQITTFNCPNKDSIQHELVAIEILKRIDGEIYKFPEDSD